MNTIKIYLAESGRIADVKKDFPLYEGQFNDKLLNVYVPTSILAPQFDIQHYIGQMSGAISPTFEELTEFVLANTFPRRNATVGDIIEFYDTDADPSASCVVYQCTDASSFPAVWSSRYVDSFGTFNNISGTSIKIGEIATKRNGTIYKSKAYNMLYIKTLTYQNVEYALYERKLPKAFTSFIGQGQNAPQLIINVVNVDTEDGKVTSLITSQTCQLDVMRSDILDEEEIVEASEFEELYSVVNNISQELLEKQDKQDDALTTESKFVVGGINELNRLGQIDRANINTNTEDIAQNKADIDYLYEHLSQPEEYIGQLTGSSLPTDQQLTNYVVSVTGRQPKNADVVFFILEVLGGADKTYKYTYSVSEWNGYEIPPIEEAYNDTFGTIKGTYGVGSTNDTLVDISGGEILNIYVKDSTDTYRNIREYLNTTTTDIANIVNGTTTVGAALRAVADEVGNDIVNTYLTQTAGASKQFVKNYALPRTFNDIFYPVKDENSNTGTYSSELPEGNQVFSVMTDSVGDFTICELTLANSGDKNRSFELSKKNTCQNTFPIYTTANCTVQLRLTTTVETPDTNGPVVASVELSNPISFEGYTTQRVEFSSVFSYLGDDVIKFDNENATITQTLEVIREDSYPIEFSLFSGLSLTATFNLNTTSLVIYNSIGKLGEQPVYELAPYHWFTVNGVTLVGDSLAQIYNNTECLVKINLSSSTEGYYEWFYSQNNCTILNVLIGGYSIRLATPHNLESGQADFAMLDQVPHIKTSTYATYYIKCFVQIDNGNNITFIVDEDDLSKKMDKSNPTGTGSFSLNRKANTIVGNYSFAEGYNTTAISTASHSEGSSTTASAVSSHAEGNATTASGSCSHSEGYNTTASGNNSHASGNRTTAQRASQFVFGEFNIADTSGADGTAKGSYVEIVGNGTADDARSNARTLDWNGNEELAGNIILKGGKLGDGKNVTYKLAIPDTTSWSADKTIATTDQLTTQYGKSLSVSGTSLSLLDENGNTLNTVTTQDTGATSVGLRTGDTGNAVTNMTYDVSTRKITFEKGETFVKTSDVDSSVSTTSTNPVQNRVIVDFVNSSIATSTANFIGTFADIPTLNAYSGTLTPNDYAFVMNSVITDNGNDWADFATLNAYNKALVTEFDYAWVINGTKFDLYRFDIVNQQWNLRVQNTDKADVTLNNAFNRYKYNGTNWLYEFTLNNSSFTAAQWAAINSGLTSADKTKLNGIEAGAQVNTVTSVNSQTGAVVLDADDISDTNTTNKFVTANEKSTWSGKQDAIDASHKLSADLVDDTNTTNKFVTASDKTTWDAKQNALTAGAGITISSNTISAKGIYYCTYGTTTYAEVAQAIQDGLLPVCVKVVDDIIGDYDWYICARDYDRLRQPSSDKSIYFTNVNGYTKTIKEIVLAQEDGVSSWDTNGTYSFYTKSEIDAMIGNINTLLSQI